MKPPSTATEVQTQKIPTRRVKFLMVDPADFMYLFTEGLEVREGYKLVKGVPKDAQLITLAADPMRGGVMLVVESKTYKKIPVTEMPPVQPVKIEIP